jgi:hypothetical protein
MPWKTMDVQEQRIKFVVAELGRGTLLVVRQRWAA